MQACEVCEIQKQNDAKYLLFENDDWAFVLRPDNQKYIGMSVVSLKTHVPVVSQLTNEQWLSFAEMTRWAEERLSNAFSPTHYNWMCLMNNGAADGVTHVHWHCVPRYDKPVEFEGVEFIDPEWPKAFYPMNEARTVSSDILDKIAQKIKQ